MKQYKIVKIKPQAEDTEKMLNTLTKDGWSVICSYAHSNNWLILTKSKEEKHVKQNKRF